MNINHNSKFIVNYFHMTNALAKNIKYLRTTARSSQAQFGKAFGVSRDNIASYERGTEPKIEFLTRIVNFYHISFENLIHDDLEEICEYDDNTEKLDLKIRPNSRPNIRPNLANEEVKEKKVLYGKEGDIPLVEISAVAGFGNPDFAISKQDVKDYYVIPKFKHRKIDFMIEVSGSSMYPKYNSGDVVACTIIKESNFIQWNKVHVIATKEQGILIKRLKKGNDDKFLLAISDNPDYDPFEVPVNEIEGIALVVGVIRLE